MTPAPAPALPPDDGPRGLPGATVETLVRNGHPYHLYTKDGARWLSTSTVLKIMRYGELSDQIPPAALEYTRLRGTIVGDACALWVRAGRPDPIAFGAAIDTQLEEWKAAQPPSWKRFTVAPFLTALSRLCERQQFRPTGAEVCIENPLHRTFGYCDLYGEWPRTQGTTVGSVELKTSTRLYRAHVLQAASYGTPASHEMVARLGKDGAYEAVAITPDDTRHFAWLARSAHELVAEWLETAARTPHAPAPEERRDG